MRCFAVLLLAVLGVTGCGAEAATQIPTTVPTFRSTIEVLDSSFAPPQHSTSTRYDRIDGSYIDADRMFDAGSRTHSQLFGNSDATRETNTSVGGPDADTDQNTVLAQYVVANAPQATPTTMLNRPALTLSFATNTPIYEFDHATVTVDVETGLPLRITTTMGNRPFNDWRVTRFERTESAPSALPTLDQREVQRSNDGFVDTQLELVRNQVGYDAPAVRQMPNGFELRRVLTHRGRNEPTGVEGSNPQADRIVALEYAKGWQRILITTRPVGASSMAWSDPFATQKDEFGSAASPLALSEGALAGARGQMVVSPAEVPHLWAVGADYVFTVAGSVTSDDLLTVARSVVNP